MRTIENQNDACRSSADYDKPWQQQSEELDVQAREDITYKMQEMLYKESPDIILTYPKLLEAWNTSKWAGWTGIPQGGAAIAHISDNVCNYYKVGPKTADAAVKSSNKGLIVGIVIAALVVVGIVVLLVMWRKPRAEEG